MIATGKSKKETNWKNKTLKYSDLVEKLSTTTRTRETYAEYKAMTREEQGNVKDVGGFVGGSLKNGRRKAENVQSRTLLTLDLDYVKGDVWSSIEMLCKFSIVMYSTHTHTPDNQRLRLVIPLSKPVLPDEYQAISRMIASDLGIDQFDDTTYEPFRLMYWPSTSCDGEYVFKVTKDLAWLNPDDVLARYVYGWQDMSYWPESSRATAKLTSTIKKQEDPLLKKGVIGAFCRTYSISEAIGEFLDDIYTAGADDTRYTFVDGSTAGGVVVYEDKFSFSHHGTDPTSGILCNAFDLVRIHKFGELDDKIKEGTPANKIPSFTKMSEFASSDKKVKLQLGQDTLEKCEEDFKSSGEDWMTQMGISANGKVKVTRDNFLLIIENHPAFKGKFKYNDFSERPEIRGAMPWDKETEMREWQDTDDAGIKTFIEKFYEIDSPIKCNDALRLAFKNKSYNPVKNYFESITWDGVKRVDNLLIDYFNSANTEYSKFTIRKWLVGGVKRVYERGAKFDNIIILAGVTDIGKSTFFHTLAGDEWFTDSLKANMEDKVVMETMGGKLIAEFGEMSGMKKMEVETIKHFLTKQEFRARLAFDKRTSSNKIHWIYSGTTNGDEFLKDKTGNRRFWPVEVFRGAKSIWDDLPKDRDQIWAEACQLYKDGEDINLTGPEKLLAIDWQEKYREIDEIEQALIDILDWSASQELWVEKTHTQIVSILRLTDRQKGQANRGLKATLLKKGVTIHKKNTGSFYKIPPEISDFL